MSRTDAGALARGVSVGGGALLPLSAFCGVAVFRISRHCGQIRPRVSRDGCSVAAEMDMYPKYAPWVFVMPTTLGAREDGKLCVDVGWSSGSTFADVIGPVIAHIDGTCRESDT